MQQSLFTEIIVDNFACGGGASSGMENATGRPVDIAINHDPKAIAMHKVNHPDTEHYCEDVWDVDPRAAVKGRMVALCWFSPDCKHFSKAKGGKPVDKNIRGLAWVALRWAATVKPRVIMLENVEEFKTWGPLIPKRDPKTGRMLKLVSGDDDEADARYVVAEPGEVVPPEDRVYIPDPKRKGITFKAFVNALKRQGYQVDWKELRACDYGAPTIRKRFFLIARCDGRPIVWPKPTHGDPNSAEVKSGKLKSWRTAAEIIDWSLPCPSIFDRKKSLAKNTLKRIARGVQRFVIDNPRPFIVKVNHHGDQFRGQEINEPIQTITAKNGWSLISPFIARIGQTGFGGDRMQYQVERPLTTITTKAEHILIAPVIARQFGKSVGHSVDWPLGTITAGGGGKSQLVAAFLSKYHGEVSPSDVRGQNLNEPLRTLDTSNRFALTTAFLAKHYGGNYNGSGAGLDEPVPTITTVDHNALVTGHIIKLRGTCQHGQPVTEPMPTVTAGGLHVGEIRSFLLKYYGTNIGHACDEPLQTITAKHRFALETAELTTPPLTDDQRYKAWWCARLLEEYGIKQVDPMFPGLRDLYVTIGDYILVDIGMRMLEPHELYAAHAFPSNYIIDRDIDGNKFSKATQVAMCGNSVPPVLPASLVGANLPELCVDEIAVGQ